MTHFRRTVFTAAAAGLFILGVLAAAPAPIGYLLDMRGARCLRVPTAHA